MPSVTVPTPEAATTSQSSPDRGRHHPVLLRYPEGWLLIAVAPALIAGVVLGLRNHGQTIDFQAWWLLPGIGAAAFEGLLGGWLFAEQSGPAPMAAIGAVCSWVVFGLAVSVSATGTVDPGGFGWPEATIAMSAILFVPMFLGAGISQQVRGGNVRAKLRSAGIAISVIGASGALIAAVVFALLRLLRL